RDDGGSTPTLSPGLGATGCLWARNPGSSSPMAASISTSVSSLSNSILFFAGLIAGPESTTYFLSTIFYRLRLLNISSLPSTLATCADCGRSPAGVERQLFRPVWCGRRFSGGLPNWDGATCRSLSPRRPRIPPFPAQHGPRPLPVD